MTTNVFFATFMFFLSISASATTTPVSCPQTLSVTVSGIESAPMSETIQSHPRLLTAWQNLSEVKTSTFQLKLFASEVPDLSSIECMNAPGACLNCFYYDDQIPADKTRIHSLHYNTATTWMGTAIINHGFVLPFGFYLDSFSAEHGVQIKSGLSPYVLQQADFVDVNCKPQFMGDLEIPCDYLLEKLGLVNQIQIH